MSGNDTEPPKEEHEHDFSGEWDIVEEATCTKPGKKTITCECGKTKTEEIPATGHDYKDDETNSKDPTCTEDGKKVSKCECGDVKEEVISATGHDYDENGKCNNCGEIKESSSQNSL